MAEKYRAENPEVLYSDESITTTDRSNIERLKQLSSRNPRKRIRLCTHGNPGDLLHEMLIVHQRGAYVRPHKHSGKTESTHIIEGKADVVLFDAGGRIEDVIRMGDYASGMTFYYRMAVPVFHTLIIRSEFLVFHETTNGPFERRDTVLAPWSPEDGEVDAISRFMAELDDSVGRMR